MSSDVGTVLIGCGWFARVAHIPALKRLEGEGRIRLVGSRAPAICTVAKTSSPTGRLKKSRETRMSIS